MPMGHKNRPSPALPSPPPPPPVPGGVVTTATASLVPLDQKLKGNSIELETTSSNYTTIKLECEKALNVLRRGNYIKALRLMKEMCAKNKNSPHSALIHRVRGTVFVRVSSIIDDPNTKQRQIRNATESAKKAVSLAPNSIEFAHFYANLLYEEAIDQMEYEEVVHECDRALAIENPTDPGKESWLDESQQKISTADARIGHVQNDLKLLIQKANFASIQNWVKSLGNGVEKIRVLPLRRDPKDPMG